MRLISQMRQITLLHHHDYVVSIIIQFQQPCPVSHSLSRHQSWKRWRLRRVIEKMYEEVVRNMQLFARRECWIE